MLSMASWAVVAVFGQFSVFLFLRHKEGGSHSKEQQQTPQGEAETVFERSHQPDRGLEHALEPFDVSLVNLGAFIHPDDGEDVRTDVIQKVNNGVGLQIQVDLVQDIEKRNINILYHAT